MNEHLERDPLETLRAADPVDVDDLPSASLARIRARVREDVMTTKVPTPRPSRARLLGLGLGAAAIATLALIIVVGRPGAAPGVQPGDSAASVQPGGSAGSVQPGGSAGSGLVGGSPAGSGLVGGSPTGSSPTGSSPTGGLQPGGSVGSGVSASCVEPYDGPASVARRGLAFDGTVTAIDGDRVTFAVNAWYRGPGGATITLDAAGMTGTTITSAGGPNLTVGGRYLVAGEDQFAWACGYTQPYDPAIAAQWAAAARG